MLLRLIELGEHIDEVVCCDTYKEFPAMYRHIEKVKKVVEQAGIKFTELRSHRTFDYLMFDHEPKRKDESLKHHKGYSWPGPRNRWCTSKLKVEIVGSYLKEIKKTHNVVEIDGIAFDEGYRLERENNKQYHKRHPLVEWGWTEKDALQYCYNHGYDLEGLYEIFHRVSCWCCPLQSLAELRKLREHFPDLWQQLKDMDNRTWRKFRADYSVEDLEKRFDFEKQRKAQGLSITNRDFFVQLGSVLRNSDDREE